MLRIHDSLSGDKRPLEPLEPGLVRLYVCGVTAYDYCHLGHARVMIVFDMVVRYLRARGYQVIYVRNVTDIDDKIIRRAAEEGVDPRAVAEKYTEAMREDATALGLTPPDAEPRATEHIEQIVAMIGRLLDHGYAYAGDNGDVYYDISRFEGYGRLSGKRLADLRAGARVEVDEAKSDPLDFVLWKAAKPGEPSWAAPWGKGRPGWHIECSAMSTHCLGESFDIHGGGLDLKFPHHENEIAQSEAATGKPFVSIWMHNGFVTVDEEKMAKSLGNFLTIRDLLQRYRAEEIRYFILSSHYRSPLAYSDVQMANARGALSRLYTALRGIEPAAPPDDAPQAARFAEAMDDDFNTPEALAALFDLAREINRLRDADPARAAGLAGLMRCLGGEIGLLRNDPVDYLQAAAGGPDASVIEAQIEARRAARAAGDFAAADRIRDELAAEGVQLEDGPEGTTWRRAEGRKN
jgi:cysteinyl-tRNA synthetase